VLILHRPETQTLYAQLYELVATHELELVGGFATGLPIEREVRGRTYSPAEAPDNVDRGQAYGRGKRRRTPGLRPNTWSTTQYVSPAAVWA
jgi:hypothetical protein